MVPSEALPFSTPSTNHKIEPVPPTRVAVRVCGCEVVTAESCGDRETVTLEDGGGGGVDAGGGGVVGAGEEVPPPQPIRAKQRRVVTMANGTRPFVRGMDEERLRT